jgi:hypothetical protein
MRQICAFCLAISSIVLSMSLVVLAFAQQSAKNSILALTHVSVIDVSAPDAKAALRQEKMVIINGSRILAVGAKLRIPPGARVIDAKGKFLSPRQTGSGANSVSLSCLPTI